MAYKEIKISIQAMEFNPCQLIKINIYYTYTSCTCIRN